MPNQNKPTTVGFEPQSLFKDWVKLSPPGDGEISSTFKDYKLTEVEVEDEDGGWLDIDNREATRAQHSYLQKYAASEHLAHSLAYQNLSANSIVDVVEEDGSTAQYRCQPLKTTHAGLVGYVLVPTQTKPGQIPDLKVIFRGTDPSSWASVSRDLEGCGAGSSSFAENRDLILEQINQTIGNQRATITIAGHSLGGADAQNCTAALIDAISQNQGIHFAERDTETQAIPLHCRDQFTNVDRIRLFTYNAAGVPQVTAEKTTAQVGLLAEKRTKGEPIPTIESYNQLVGGDAVQQTGEAHLLSNVPKHHAEVDVLKAHIGSEGHHKIGLPAATVIGTAGFVTAGLPGLIVAATVAGTSAGLGIRDTAQSHTEHLHKAPRAVQYETHSNATPKGRAQVKAELSNKSGALNTLHKAGCAFLGGVQSITQSAAMTFGFSAQKKQAIVSPSLVPQAPKPRPWYRALI